MSKDNETTLFAAVAAAIGEVKQLGKSERNKFDNYDFVSIDKFLALVNPICAAHGLFPHISQTNVEFYENEAKNGNKSTWARFFYEITLMHSSGEFLVPAKMMVAVPMNGAQASGSAQSYALKQFFRGMFMIPTGDKDDPDFNKAEDQKVTPMGGALRDAWKDGVMDGLPANATAEEKADAFTKAIITEMRDKKSEAGIEGVWTKRTAIIEGLRDKFPALYNEVFEAYEEVTSPFKEEE